MSELLQSSIFAAISNSVVAILFKIITFALNAFIIRRVSGDVLGIVNVRLILLVDTIIFISREAFRKACLKKPENGDWRGTINILWCSLLLGIPASGTLGYLWMHSVELPSQEDQYRKAVILMCFSALIELSMEAFFVIGQIFQWVMFRAVIDMVTLLLRSGLFTLAVIYDPENAILWFASAYLFSVFFQWIAYLRKMFFEFERKSILPLKTLTDVIPDIQDRHLDPERSSLTWSFFKQGFLKQVLTEGEKYIFTWFSLMSLTDQGIYDVVANLGSLAARLVFSKVEEAAYLFFNQSVKRGSDKVDPEVIKMLFRTLRTMTLFGLIVLTFGYSYSHLLLHLYGGQNLSSGIGPSLLRGHCLFVLFMAVNGVSECYSFAIMTSDQVDKYNYKMTLMAIFFLSISWILAKLFGPIGFIIANCCNFAMRILHSCYVIQTHHGHQSEINPLTGFLLPLPSFLILTLSAILCQVSEVFLYNPDDWVTWIGHLTIGGIVFIVSILVIIRNEPDLLKLIRKKVFGKTE